MANKLLLAKSTSGFNTYWLQKFQDFLQSLRPLVYNSGVVHDAMIVDTLQATSTLETQKVVGTPERLSLFRRNK